MKKYLVINGYDQKRFDKEEDALVYIINKVDEYKHLNPTLISKTESTQKTFKGEVKFTTFIYLYSTLYTETLTMVESEFSYPLEEIKHYNEVMQWREETKPIIKEEVKKLKKFLKENNWKVTEIGVKASGEDYIRFQSNDHNDSFTIETEERHLENETTDNQEFSREVYSKFINIDGYFEDILKAF